MRSRKLAFIPLVVGMLACMGSATANAAPCSSASLSAYQAIGAGGCTVGSLTFSNFFIDGFPGGASMQIAPSSVFVTPFANGFQLSSNTALSAAANELLGLRFTFDASAMSLTGGTVALGEQNSVTGDGVITAILDAGPAGSAIALIAQTINDSSASFVSPPLSFYNASFELGIDGGTAGSATLGPVLATISFVTGQAVPEPGTAALALVGLLAAFARRGRVSERV